MSPAPATNASAAPVGALVDVFASLPDPWLLVDAQWLITHANRAALRLFEGTSTPLIGSALWMLWPGQLAAQVERTLRDTPRVAAVSVLEATLPPIAPARQFRAQAFDWGMAVRFEALSDPMALSPLLQRALDRLNDIVIITTAAGVDTPHPQILYVNDAFERRTGYTREEALGKTPRMLQGELTQRPVLDTIRSAMSRWEPVRCELINYTKAGEAFWLELDIVPLADDNGWYTHWVAIERDATDRKAREALAERSQRLDAVDQLSGGIAHDFNNVLTVTLGYAELLAQQLKNQPALRQMAVQINDAARRGSELTQRLLAFARRAPLDPSAVELPGALGTFRETLGRTFTQDIAVRLQLDDALWPGLIDPGHLQNALLYLALNARDAMPGGGELLVAARNVHLQDEAFAESTGTVSGDFVAVSLTDTGSGIAAADLPRVIEPFFTTRQEQHHQGMGLSMVYGFMRQSGGQLRIDSTPGVGTSVTLYIPRWRPQRASQPGKPLVLLVEDDELVRHYAENLLQHLGYRVVTAADAQGALALLRGEPDIALLFTDLVLPGGIDGGELALTTRALRPGLPVLLSSGYPEAEQRLRAVRAERFKLLRKPYRPAQLAEALREALAAS